MTFWFFGSAFSIFVLWRRRLFLLMVCFIGGHGLRGVWLASVACIASNVNVNFLQENFSFKVTAPTYGLASIEPNNALQLTDQNRGSRAKTVLVFTTPRDHCFHHFSKAGLHANHFHLALHIRIKQRTPRPKQPFHNSQIPKNTFPNSPVVLFLMFSVPRLRERFLELEARRNIEALEAIEGCSVERVRGGGREAVLYQPSSW